MDSESPGVPSVGCTLRYSLAVTGDSESDDDGLVLLISYKILLDITGSSEQAVFKLTEDTLLALVSSTTYCYQTKRHEKPAFHLKTNNLRTTMYTR